MTMKSREIQEGIDNELKRVQIRNQANYPAWYAALQPHARQVIDFILEEDVTPELIRFALEAPDEEWNNFQFLRIIGGGNPSPSNMPGLTNFTLADILIDVEDFGNLEE
jgi:hypothetical protein